MNISIDEGHELVVQAMGRLGYDQADSVIVADHLIDAELRGYGAGGLARAVTLTDRITASAPFGQIVTENETPTAIALDGGDQVGYIVAKLLTKRVIEKALAQGVAMGGARNTWCAGMFSYYLEMITEAGLVGLITSSGGPTVAPYGGTKAVFGTNPVAFGFPTESDPVIWDIGTSDALLADLSLAVTLGQPIREGIAYDSAGRATTDPVAALDGGAITVWGGHRGSGLALSAQLLGMMVGSQTAPPWLTDMGLFIAVFDPRVFTGNFPARAESYAADVRAIPPVEGGEPVRVPFDRSRSDRSARRAGATIDVADEILNRLRAFASADA